MSNGRVVPPVDYLAECSDSALADFVLLRMDRAASLRKELQAVLEDLIDAAAEARFAEWVARHRRALKKPVRAVQRPLPLVKRAG